MWSPYVGRREMGESRGDCGLTATVPDGFLICPTHGLDLVYSQQSHTDFSQDLQENTEKKQIQTVKHDKDQKYSPMFPVCLQL